MDTRPAPIAWSPDLDAAVHRSFLKNVNMVRRAGGWVAWSDATRKDHLGRPCQPYRVTPVSCTCPAGSSWPRLVCCHRARLLLDLDLIVMPRRDRPFAAMAAD